MHEILLRLQRIDELIRVKSTGTPGQLARKIGISERTIYEYLKLMKSFGAPIKFSNYRKSYYYNEEGRFKIFFEGYEAPGVSN